MQTQANVRALAERVYQLGGTPNLDPEVLHTRSFTSYQALPSADVVGMVRENLLAARIMVQTLQEAIRWVGDADPTTRRLLEGVLEDEEREASELRLLADGRSA
ncbi:ferritin-like domain-containing protein [Streptomyces sp. NPDC051020]|uniref:ferritin-like domain-containing protein n=1 Tax=Streptomyces sp. NPDC051020 TaxID=3155409 RepID=UPI003428D6B2